MTEYVSTLLILALIVILAAGVIGVAWLLDYSVRQYFPRRKARPRLPRDRYLHEIRRRREDAA